MIRTLILPIALLLGYSVQAQTSFHINQIAVTPDVPNTSDNVGIELIGDLSDTGAYIEVAFAEVAGNMVNITVVALSNGGFTVLVPHTESIQLGQMPAGDYTIEFTDASTGIHDWAPHPQHTFTVTGNSGGTCDLQLISVQWHAFNDTAVVVHVTNVDSVQFLYPNFILFDADGDTLAFEEVYNFDIATESWHVLHIMDGVSIPTVPFDGRLELWTVFTSELTCSWDLNLDLCPSEPCAPLFPILENWGGALVIGTFDWSIHEDGELLGSGQFVMSDTVQSATDSLCLPPGSYTMTVVANQPSSGGWPVFGAMVDHTLNSSDMQDVYGPVPVLPFNFYLPCADTSNGMDERSPGGLIALPLPGGMLVQRIDGASLGVLWLFDAQGRLLFSTTANTDAQFVPMPKPGVYLLRTTDAWMKVVGGVE